MVDEAIVKKKNKKKKKEKDVVMETEEGAATKSFNGKYQKWAFDFLQANAAVVKVCDGHIFVKNEEMKIWLWGLKGKTSYGEVEMRLKSLIRAKCKHGLIGGDNNIFECVREFLLTAEGSKDFGHLVDNELIRKFRDSTRHKLCFLNGVLDVADTSFYEWDHENVKDKVFTLTCMQFDYSGREADPAFNDDCEGIIYILIIFILCIFIYFSIFFCRSNVGLLFNPF